MDRTVGIKNDAAAGDQPKERISETGQVNELLYAQDSENRKKQNGRSGENKRHSELQVVCFGTIV